jgi:hypothetical protein
LAGKTNATLVVSNFTVSDSYYFVATNHYGSTNSAVANVNVVSGAPQIYTDIVPLSWQAYAGSQVAFTVTAFGTAPLYYQWYQNGLAISGATNSSYALSVLPGTNTYACVVNNTFNGSSAATSSTATVVGVSLPTDGYSQLVLSRQPIAYWQLAETSGSIAYDNQGGHNATYNNVQLGVTGSPTDPDLAAEFGTLAADNSFAGEIDNSASGLANIDFSTQANAEFSLEAWVNGGSSQVSSACFIGKGYSGSEQFVMDYYNNGFRFFVRDSANVTHTCQSTVRLDGNWHHLVGVCDQINGIMHLYVDGVDAADASIQAGKSVLEPAVSSLPAANLVSIGSRSTGSTATTLNYQFVGVMDDVAIYNEALDASQVQADYQAGSAVTPPTIDLTLTGHQLVINFTGTLLSATNAAGPYTPVAGAASPYTTSATNEQTFFRTSNP